MTGAALTWPSGATLLQAIALLPFLGYALKDNVLHFKARAVPRPEHALHAILGVILAVAIGAAFRGHEVVLAWSLVAFAVAGAIDEYGFHRGLPVSEADVHAKQHLALLLFFVCHYALATLA